MWRKRLEQRLREEAPGGTPASATTVASDGGHAAGASPGELADLAGAVAACRSDRDAVALLLDACEREAALFALIGEEAAPAARRAGGDLWLRYRLCALRYLMVQDPPDGDLVRESYSELLEDYSGDADALAAIREVGKEIDALVAAGRLGRALVRRGAWRTPEER